MPRYTTAVQLTQTRKGAHSAVSFRRQSPARETDGEAPPDVAGEHVLLVDFSYKASVLRDMAVRAASVTVLDHHKTAQADLAPLLAEGVVAGEFDMNRSGAVMAWQAVHPGKPVPQLLLHVQDRDLWQFKLEGTREIQACVFSHPYEFRTWDWLVSRCEFTLAKQEMMAEGGAIERKHFKDIGELLKIGTRRMVIGGVDVAVANLPYTMSSDAAGKLAEGAPFGACYSDRVDARVFSLRSRGDGGADVSEIASRYGGGGHKNAAGFQAPLGWEGDATTTVS
jgi:oligoribonuclease NrnB/cAMP/cGMP phosphodiesterase (DHH superfamily)